MGQTLTHGVYLPDEGERNCYSGLAANWQLLDTSVGTIAEHTSALAGKAPLVHTHGKAAITDLFTSANTWAEGQTIYSYANIQSQVLERAVTPASTAHVSFNLRDKNNHDLGMFRSLTYSSSGNSIITVFGVTQIKDGQVDPTGTVDTYGFTETCKSDGTKYFTFDGYMGSNLVPLSVNQSIGSSSYQWNNLYANNYYYNGTAWGLDKVNEWSNTNYFNKTLFCDFSNLADKAIPNAYIQAPLIIVEGNTSPKTWHGGIALERYTNGDEGFQFLTCSYVDGTTQQLGALRYLVSGDGTESYCYSRGPTKQHLGTSTNKWTTLNGINPGALSLPKIVAKATADISSAIVGADNQQHLDGTDNNYTAALDGWISMCISGFTQSNELWITVYDQQNETWGTSAESSTRNTMFIIFPIRANQKMRIRMKCTSVDYARFYPCEGNV